MVGYDFPFNEENLDREYEELTKNMSEIKKNKYLNDYISVMNDEDLGESNLEIDLKKEFEKLNTNIILRKVEKSPKKYSLIFKNKNSN